MNILLADDHRILRTGLKLLLASQDDCHVVAEASNGQEVLERLEDTPVDVVLLDLSMPVMNGIDCLREIRRRHYDVKVLVLTMYSEQQYIKEVMMQGANGYLCKDTLDSELFQALHTVASKISRDGSFARLLIFSRPITSPSKKPLFTVKVLLASANLHRMRAGAT